MGTRHDLSDEEPCREQCRRGLERDVMSRIEYGFVHMHQPVLDDVAWRAFATMAEYRERCEKNLPACLGYRRVPPAPSAETA